MIVKLHSQRLQTVDEIRAFLSGSTTFDFELHSRKAYLEKVSGLSRAQVARLIRQYRDTGRLRDQRGRPTNAFPRRYTPQDVGLLVEVDTLHVTDTDAECINRRVAGLLKKLHIELTKTRPRKSNDNALVESKNASVLRKHMSYQHIPGHFVQPVNDFLPELSPPVPVLRGADQSQGKMHHTPTPTAS